MISDSKLALQTAQLMVEAQQVIAMRIPRLCTGDRRALHEAEKMVTEKLSAAFTTSFIIATAMMTGQSQAAVARDIMRDYAVRVRANHRRLSRR